MCDVTLTCDDSGACDIELDGTVIGVIEGTFDTIEYIEIEAKHRENGYGQAAVEQYLREAEQRDVSHIETSAVTHRAAEKIFSRLGFTRCTHDSTHFECDLSPASAGNA